MQEAGFGKNHGIETVPPGIPPVVIREFVTRFVIAVHTRHETNHASGRRLPHAVRKIEETGHLKHSKRNTFCLQIK